VSVRRLSIRTKLLLVAVVLCAPLATAVAVLAQGRNGRVGILAGSGLALTLAIVLLLRVIRSITDPLRELDAAYVTIASGDLDVAVSSRHDDEVGRIVTAFTANLATLRRTRQLEAAELDRAASLRSAVATYERFAERIASGDLEARVVMDTTDPDLRRLRDHLNRMAESLGELSMRVRDAATQMSGASSRILSVASEHSTATNAQAASVAQTSVTIDEVRASARQVSERSEELARQAEDMREVASAGADSVDAIVSGMAVIRATVGQIATDIARLSDQTDAIQTITRTVNDLADQSNMLALNATIEAARAGEQGRGFAVVAQEVRALAEQSKSATGEAQRILEEIQAATRAAVRSTEEGVTVVDDGVSRAHLAGQAIDQMEGTIRETAQFVNAIAASVREQQIGMDQIADAIADVAGASNQMASGAHDTQTAAALLADLATDLDDLTGRYRLGGGTSSPDESAPSALTPREVADQIVARVGVECGAVFAFRGGEAIPIAQTLPGGHEIRPFIPEGAGAVATVFRTGGSARVDLTGEDVTSRAVRMARASDYRMSVAVPIRVNGALWGCLLAATRAEGITRGAEEILTWLAETAARGVAAPAVNPDPAPVAHPSPSVRGESVYRVGEPAPDAS
jgi:methyl-accepting chemotaxis protein